MTKKIIEEEQSEDDWAEEDEDDTDIEEWINRLPKIKADIDPNSTDLELEVHAQTLSLLSKQKETELFTEGIISRPHS